MTGAELWDLLDTVRKRSEIEGPQAAFSDDREFVSVSSGVACGLTGVETTDDTLVQVGSTAPQRESPPLGDERFATNLDRLARVDELVEELEATMRTRTTNEWVEILLDAGTPAGKIANFEEVVADPHTIARQMVQQVDHPVEGTINTLGIPVKLSVTPGQIRRPAPLLGEHTSEVLEEAGYDAAEIAALRDREVVL